MLVTIDFVLHIAYLMLTLLILIVKATVKKCQKIYGAEIAYLKLMFTCIKFSCILYV